VPRSALLLCNKDVSELVSYAWGWREYRHFDVLDSPARADLVLAGDRPLYAALVEKPGRPDTEGAASFEATLRRFPGRARVVETMTPWRFQLYRLR